MSSTPAGRVREAAGTLTTPGRLDLRAITACARELDTALRASGAEGDAAAAEFCSGPPGEPARSALRWCAGVLHRGVPEGANPTDVKGATFVVGVALQVLVSASGADWREQFGHVTRSGAHASWPARGAALIARPWNPDLHAPTGILPPLLALTRSVAGGPQVRLRALQLAGSIARDHDARPEMVLGGWPAACAKALEARPRPDHTDAETKEFIYTRETWQYLDEAMTEAVLKMPVPPRPDPDSGSVPDPDPDPPSPSSPGRPSPPPLVWRRAPEAGERDATEADFPPGETDWHGQMVRVRGLVARPDLNGALGYAQGVGGSSDRVAVLVNPLGGEDAPAEVVSVRRERLTVFEGHRREDAGAVGGAGSRTGTGTGGGAGAGAGAGSSRASNGSREVPASTMMERVAARGPVQFAEGEDEVTRRLERASVRAAAGDFHAAAEGFEAALAAATEAMDNKSLARAHCAYHAWFARTKLADDLDRERARDGDGDDIPGDAARGDAAYHRAKAAAHASAAMDLLEFRLLAKLRDARSGESPPSSLFELTDEESRFFDVLLARGLADELWTFLGAPLAVTLARDHFLPALERAETETNANANATRPGRREDEDEDEDAADDVDDTVDTPDASSSTAALWRGVAIGLRAVDAERRLGALLVRWRPRGSVVGEPDADADADADDDADDAPGPGESPGETRALGTAAPATLPEGTRAAFRRSRSAFLRHYFAALKRRFAPGADPAERARSMFDALRSNPLVLEFASGGYREMMDEDDSEDVHVGGAERARRSAAERAGGSGEAA